MFFRCFIFVHLPAISREDGEESNHQHQLHHHHHHNHRGNSHGNKVSYNGYNSEEYLDRLETNGNIPANKSDLGYGKRKYNDMEYSLSSFVECLRSLTHTVLFATHPFAFCH